ncbi:hypothetical protein niasHS_002031 [Heterodera schachtii]|uniref:Peptidase M12A domain-containing protein n=1 Tax=Heterodera schachtii TaxID=97005 RepID=A0ABD2K5M2_HETSC
MNKCLALVVLIALISALDSAVLRQRHFVKAENAPKAEQKEKPATSDVVDNGNPDKSQGAVKEGQNSEETKSQEKQGTEANSKKPEMPEIRETETSARNGTAPLLLKHELVKGEANTRKKRQSGGSANGDKAAEKMPNKFDLTLPNHDPSKSAAKAAEYKPEFDRNNTPVDYDGKEKKCKVKAHIDVMSKELSDKIKENGADKRDLNAAEDGCGLKGYAEWSRCSKVAFYGNRGYKYAAEKYGIEKAEPPTKNFNDMDEFDKYGFMHDTVLLLFDGCAVCNGNKMPNVNISLLQYMPTMEMVEKQQKSTGSFAYGVPLMERLCSEKKPDTDKDEYYMQKLEYKYRVVLEVNHTCDAGGEHKTHYIWLPEIDVFDKETVVGRVMQIRQLKLDFADMDDTVDLTLKLSESDFDKSGQFVTATLIPFKPEPAVPPSAPTPMVPIATNVNHLGVKCTQIAFSDFMPQFFLNVSGDTFAIACQKFAAPIDPSKVSDNFSPSDYLANACAKVPTSLNCNKDHELIVCYKTKKVKHVVNNEIAEVCQKHLGNVGQQQAHGFRIRFCAKRHTTEQLISAESILDFSFSDKIYKRDHSSYSYKSDELSAMMETMPFFFIEFGNENHHSILRGKGYGAELSADLRLTIGTILPSIALEPSSSQNKDGGAQHRTKLLHFVPPASEALDVFFQTRFPIFSQRIIRKTNLLPYENNPEKTTPDKCDLLGNDCEPTREILLKIQDVLQCCSPFNPWSRCLCDGSNSVDKSEFAAPPGEKGSAPDTKPSSNSSSRWAHLGDPLYGSDIFYTKETAQKRYDDIMESCSKCVQKIPEKSTKNRRKRQAIAPLNKWPKFPIAIHLNTKRIAKEDYNERLKAIRRGTVLITKHTCVSFTIDFNKMADEGIEVIDDGANWSSAGRNYTTVWQELSLDENSKGTAGHELLHALALAHEMNRDDAFYFIKLNPSNRDKRWMENSEPLNKTDNFGFPYDFGSLMQYWASVGAFGYYDFITMGRFYQRTIGQRERLSFRDSAIINHIYCGDNCKGKKNECQNGGYLNPKQCNECLCPEGYGGAHCDQLEQNVSNCPEICGPTHVEIKYRKDKRAQGALICCANDILRQNIARNWIEAEEKDVDIIISGRHATTDKVGFELTYETDGAKLLPSCACTDPHLLFDPKRSAGYFCVDPCEYSTCNMKIGGCSKGFLVFNDKVVQNESAALPISCHKREGSAESFWYFWEQKDIEPMRIEEVHCVKCDTEKDKGSPSPSGLEFLFCGLSPPGGGGLGQFYVTCHSKPSSPSHPIPRPAAGLVALDVCGAAVRCRPLAAPLRVLIALISALDSAVLRQRRFVKTENALKQEQKEKPGETNTRKKRQSGGLARGDNVEKMPNKFDLTLPKHDPSKSAAKAAEYKPEFDRNNTPVDYDGKEKKCKVEAKIDVMSEELMKILKENGADKRDINAVDDGCGLKGYAEWSRCSKVAFYGRDGYNASKKYGIEQAKPPTKNFNDMDEFDKFGFMHDTVLLLFDGCAICNGNKVPNVNISLLQYMPTGLLVDECKEFVNQSGKPLKLKMEMVEKQQKSTGSFAYGVPLMERLCSEKKPDTDKDEYYMQKLEYKYRVVLEVNHTCDAGGEQKTHYIWLPEIDVFDNKTVVGRVMQIRQLKLDFDDMDDTVDLTLKLSGSEFDKSGQFVKATLIPYKSEPAVPPSEPTPMAPIATNVNHLGVKCTQIVFSDLMPQFFLNVSNSVYAIACKKFFAPIDPSKVSDEFSVSEYMANTCAKVPTTLTCNKDHELIGCYKTKKVKHVVNNQIAEVCQKHLGNVGQQQAHGFRIRFCAKRHTTEQLISVESILDFSFSDKIYKRDHSSYSYKSDELSAMMENKPFFFIEFGNAKQHSTLRDKGYGAELSADLRLTIGTILPSIALEQSSSPNNVGGAQQRTKLLHFVPPAEELLIFFKTEFPIFSQRIINKTNLLPYESNPNKTAPDKCDLLGNDCEATREILLQIQDVLQCCSPFNPWNKCLCDVPNTVDKSEFAAPPGEKRSAPDTKPSSNSSSRWAHLGDPLYGSDIFYTKETAQKRYDDIMESCSKCVQKTPEKSTIKNRRKRQAIVPLNKWPKFPIAIRLNEYKIAKDNFCERLKTILGGTALIMKDTCITFMIDINKMADEGIEVIDDSGSWSDVGRNYTTVWQELSLGRNSKGTAGHELLHALALNHEMNRDDAFYFIKLNPSNRDKRWIENSEPLNKTDNFGFPYDFGSLMQYWASVGAFG